MKKILSLLLALIVLLSLLPAAAFAEGEEAEEILIEDEAPAPAPVEDELPAPEAESGDELEIIGDESAAQEPKELPEDVQLYINPLYRDRYDEDELRERFIASHRPGSTRRSDVYVGAACTTMSQLAVQVREGIKQRAVTIRVPYSGSFDYYDLIDMVEVHTGVPTEGDYIMWQYGYSWCWSEYEDDVRYVCFRFEYYTTAAQERAMDAAVSALLPSFYGSPYQRIEATYDWLCANITYDYAHLYDDDYSLQYTAYGGLIDRTCVCQGYAVLLYRLLLSQGIDCRVVTSERHAWNIAYLDGWYYNLDSTWDAGWPSYYWDWFLLNMDDFYDVDHIREYPYDQDDFSAAYPMSPTSYTLIKNGLFLDDDDVWRYYTDDFLDTSYVGLAEIQGLGWYYVRNGVIDYSANGLVNSPAHGWFYVVNGQVDFGFTGIAEIPGVGWYYAQNGQVTFSVNGLVNTPSQGWWYLVNSQVDFGFVGIAEVPNVGWYYVQGGRIDFGANGLVNTNAQGWWYVQGGMVRFDFTGIAEIPGVGWYYAQNGQITFTVSGLVNTPSQGWWYLVNSQVDFGYDGLASRSDIGWWYVRNGQIDFGYTGLINSPAHGWWFVTGGHLTFDATGLAYREDIGWWYVENSQITFSYNGTIYQFDTWWNVVNSQATPA